MPDLTTMHLKCLLDQAETMPWKSSVEVYGVPEGWDEWGLALNTGRFWLSTWSPGPVSEEELDCLELAALAPQLAEEVIRLRGALGYLVGETRLAAENSDDVVVQKRVADAIKTTIDKCKGDQDE